uniref:mTERF domain-containing protein 1, mitochondrial n=1 Tax=Dracunculus medinensis TaxID=318479 RepID=A0A158Q6D7_DRAME
LKCILKFIVFYYFFQICSFERIVNRYRKILYTEGEIDGTDFSLPPSRSNPYPFDPSVDPTLLPPTHSRSLANYVNHVPLLQNLVDLGVSLFHIDTETNIGHNLLKLDWVKDVRVKLKWLMSIGIPAENLGIYITKNPYFLLQNLDDMKVRVNYLRSKKFKRQEIIKIILEYRFWINTAVRIIDARLGWIQKTFSLSGKEVRQLVIKEPRIIMNGIRMVEFFSKDLEFDGKEIKKMVLTDPRLFICDLSLVDQNYKFLHNSIGLSNGEIIKYPLALRCRLSSLKERFNFIKLLKETDNLPKNSSISLEKVLHPSDSYFTRNVVRTTLNSYNNFLKKI